MAKKKVSKAQQKRRDARAAAQKTGMQITPQSFQVTPGTQTPNITFTPAEMASGNIYGTDIGNGLTAYTQGGPIKDPTNLRAQLGLGSTAATTTTGGGSTKTQQKTQNPLRRQRQMCIRDSNWVMQPLGNNTQSKYLNKKFWLDASDRLMYEGKAPELSDTKRARMPAFFEHANTNLPRYA